MTSLIDERSVGADRIRSSTTKKMLKVSWPLRAEGPDSTAGSLVATPSTLTSPLFAFDPTEG